MRKLSFISAVMLFALAGAAGAYAAPAVATNEALSATSSYAGATDFSSKPKAKKRGAKKRGFCPPGQAKKPGRGSAFNC
jgi:hypothetical protein